MILVYISSNVRGDQRVEAEFLDWDTELGELPLVCLYHVGVSLVYWGQHTIQSYNVSITIVWRLDGSIIIIPSHG